MCDPPRIYPSFPQYTPFQTSICDALRIYPPLTESTPFFQNYKLHSQNLPLLPRIYAPPPNIYKRPFQNIPFPPRIYPFQTPICNALRIYPPSQNIPPFSKTINDTPRIYPLSQNLTPPHLNIHVRPLQNLPLPSRI